VSNADSFTGESDQDVKLTISAKGTCLKEFVKLTPGGGINKKSRRETGKEELNIDTFLGRETRCFLYIRAFHWAGSFVCKMTEGCRVLLISVLYVK
jgi:hypothetical protein